jgi:hypothetical protein
MWRDVIRRVDCSARTIWLAQDVELTAQPGTTALQERNFSLNLLKSCGV